VPEADLIEAPAVETRLVTDPKDREVLTGRRDVDARTALARGLAEYMSQLSFDAAGGRLIRFQKVLETWAEPEEETVYPRAAVYAEALGAYDASRLTPGNSGRVQLPDGRFVLTGAEYVLDLKLDVWANDSVQRQNLVSMIEDAFVPVDFRYGPLLELPYYHGMRAAYELMEGGYIDAEDAALQRVKRAQFSVRSRVQLARLATFPEAKPRARTEVSLSEAVQSGSRLSF
jgi:hypothetical protein